MSNELKPCPFCGGDISDENIAHPAYSSEGIYKINRNRSMIMCSFCVARGPVKDSPEEAGKAWNTRMDTKG